MLYHTFLTHTRGTKISFTEKAGLDRTDMSIMTDERGLVIIGLDSNQTHATVRPPTSGEITWLLRSNLIAIFILIGMVLYHA